MKQSIKEKTDGTRHRPWKQFAVLCTLLCCWLLMPTQAQAQTYGGGSGTSSDPWLISTAAHLTELQTQANKATYAGNMTTKYFKMTGNIDMGGASLRIGANNSSTRLAYINFDGGGYAISNFTSAAIETSVAVFAHIRNTTIQNLTIKRFTTAGLYNTGGLVGYASDNNSIRNCHIEDGRITKYPEGSYLGGLVGRHDSGTLTISDCTVANDVTIEPLITFSTSCNLGGAVGGVVGGTLNMDDCLIAPKILLYAGDENVGGIVGAVYGTLYLRRVIGTTTHSYFGKSYIGSVVGHNPYADRVSCTDSYFLSQPYGYGANGAQAIPPGSVATYDWVYNNLERKNNSGGTISSGSIGNQAWGRGTNAKFNIVNGPIFTKTNYMIKATRGSEITAMSGTGVMSGTTVLYTPARTGIKVTASRAGSTHEKLRFYYNGVTIGTLSAGSTTTAYTHSGATADGTFTAGWVPVPYPYINTSTKSEEAKAVFDQWNKNVNLSWTADNPENLTGKFYIYRRAASTAAWSSGTWTNLGNITVKNGNSQAYSFDTSLTVEQMDNEYDYVVFFLEGTATAPTTPSGQAHAAAVKVNTTTAVSLNQYTIVSKETSIDVQFTVHNALNNNAAYKYKIQRKVNDGTFVDWVVNQSFNTVAEGTANSYLHTDNDPNSSCDEYTYRVVITAFNKDFTLEEKSGRITGSTKFAAVKPLKISKGEHAGFVRLQWTVDRLNPGSPEVFKVFRRVANTASAWVELETVTSSSATTYWNDNTVLTGIYYEYRVVLYQVCSGEETELAALTEIGFSQSFGTVSGRVTYGTGSAVENVNVLVKRNDLQGNESQYRSLKSNAGGTYVEWKPDLAYFNNIWTSKKWTLQFWVNPNTQHTGTKIIGNIGNVPIYLMAEPDGINYRLHWGELRTTIFPFNKFTQVAIVRNENSLHIYYALDQDKDNIRVSYSSTTYSALGTLTASTARISFGHSLNGNIDDVRFWDRPLSQEEIARDYSRVITGGENGLKIYWTFDESLPGYAFDMSRVGTVYNANHATTNALTSDADIPEDYQLSLKGITNRDGNYQINGIPYHGEGSSYSVVPMMGVHEFNPTQQLRYISPTSMVHNATDFTDVSSFKVSGTVMYEGGNYPVQDCSFEIDGKPVMTPKGEIIRSDFNGEFTISVPIGIHEVRIVKQGHTFKNNGLLIDELSGTNLNYNAPLANIKFFDQTRVKLIGRIVGGLRENDKELGFGESVNNIGANELKLTAERQEYLLSGDRTTPVKVDTTFVHYDTQYNTPMSVFGNEITIKVSPETGEYVAWVYPEAYSIGEISVKAQTGTLTIYDRNESIDLSTAVALGEENMKTSIRTRTDSVFVHKPGMVDHYEKFEVSDTVRYHAEWKYYHQATPTFSVTQTEGDQPVDYFGNVTYTFRDELNDLTEEVTLYNTTAKTYAFGKPVFTQGKEYTFALNAYEEYTNYEPEEPVYERIPVAGGMVSMSNTIDLNSEIPRIELDEAGEGSYTFMAGAPDLTTGLHTFSATVQIGNFSYYWDKAEDYIEAWHLGDRTTGTDFVTSGPDELTTILRDPPGSKSRAYIEKGSTVTQTTTSSVVNGMKEIMNLTTSLGPTITTFIGLGGGVILETDITIDASAGLTTEQKWNKETEHTKTTTFTERFQTSEDPLYVGALGDVFIGNSTNILYGLTNAINIQKTPGTTTFASSGGYHITNATSLAYGQSFATRFAFTQVELEEIMIPKWEQSIATRLLAPGTTVNTATITEPVYVSKLPVGDLNFGKMNIDTDAFPTASLTKPYDGDSYKIYFPASWTAASPKMIEFQDSVIWANNQINLWTDVLRQNEKEKVELQHLGNYSFGSGASIEQSISGSASTSRSSSFTWVLNPTIGVETGGEVLGIGMKFKMDMEYVHEETDTDKEAIETKITTGFVLQEEGDDDQLTVDYGMTKSGTFAFKTRGGRTSCPYEGEVRSKYYQPGNHILSEATMQIEVPKIDVSGAASKLNVPSNKTASFVLDLKNESETDEDVWFQLIIDEFTNPSGAELKIDGGAVGNGRMFLVKAGEVLKKTITIGKGTADKVENLGIILRSQCQHDPTDFLPDIADTTWVSVEFIPACSDVAIKTPKSNWILNSDNEKGDVLDITINAYDVNTPNFGYIQLEYRAAASPTWSTLMTYYYSDAIYDKAQGAKEKIAGRSELIYPWTMPSADGAYELRATTTTVNASDGVIGSILSSYTSPAIAGYKDVRKPTSLGAPSPASGILGAGDELSITFNESIQTGLLTKDHFSIRGILNAQEIAEPNVGLQFNGTGSARTNLPIYANGSFSIETWFSQTPGQAGTLFAYGANDNYLSLGFDATGKAVVKLGNQTLTSVTAIVADNTWKYISLSYDRATGKVTVYELEGATTNTLFNATQLTGTPEMQGTLFAGNTPAGTGGFKGAMAYLHFYSDKRDLASVASDKNVTKTGREMNLIGYWNLEEGTGNVAKDKARSRDLSLNTGWYIYPSGKAIALSGNNYVAIPTATYALNAFSNFTLEFWFRGAAQTAKTLFCADNGSIGFDAEKRLILYNADGTVNQVLDSKDLLDNNWHHVALSVKRNGMTNAIIDGATTAIFSSNLVGSFASGNYYFGAKRVNEITFDEYFTGNVDEIRIWDSALTSDVIALNRNSKLHGNESGLTAYYPFETYFKQSNGLVTVTDSNANVVADGMVTSGAAVIGDVSMAMKDARPVEDVPFTYVASDNKVVFTLEPSYFSRVEGVTLEITAENIKDMRDNRSATEKWIAYVNRNNLLWDSEAVNIIMEQGASKTFSARIVNTGGATASYAIGNLPSWLSVNSTNGNLQPLTNKDLTFTVFKGINVGSYEASIELTSGNGIREILPVQLKVTGEHPNWQVNLEDYEQNMAVTGWVQIEGIQQEDEEDILAAFRGDVCVGIASPVYESGFNAYFVYMMIGGNSDDDGSPISFKFWDASTGNIYPLVELSLEGNPLNLVFLGDDRKGSPDKPVYFNAVDVIEQSIDIHSGWNWISFNVDYNNPTLIDQVKEKAIDFTSQIKARAAYMEYNASQWGGTLTSLSSSEMFSLRASKQTVLHVVGKPIKPADVAITLNSGWNWIGYTPQVATTVTDALAGIPASEEDQIKGRTGYKIWSSQGWIGSLVSMDPGKGYKYYSNKTGDSQVFHYPTVTTSLRSADFFPNAEEAVESYWEADDTAFDNNMTVTAGIVIDRNMIRNGSFEIAAFAGEECRGSAVMQYIDGFINPYMGFLMVHGERNEEISFRIYEHNSGKTYRAEEKLSFQADAIHGNPDNLFMLRMGAEITGMDKPGNRMIEIFPNPVVNELFIRSNGESIQRIKIFDVSGKLLLERDNFSEPSINVTALQTGTYVIHIITKEEIVINKFIKK